MLETMVGRELQGGRYRVDAEVGRGAMGQVYRGQDGRLRRPVAIKVLLPSLRDNPSLRRRFLSEALVQANIDHPGIVRATDIVDDDTCLAIVMDYVDGESLDQHLARHGGKLGLGEAWKLLEQIAGAVSAAHAVEVVHRDLKPGNVLVERGTQPLRARVCDFGIAKIMADEGASAGTVFGTVMGTPAYMPPEQLRGQLDIDQRVDVYALGVMLYQLLTGALPYGRGTDVPRAMQAEEPPARPSALEPSLPPGIDAIVARATALDRQERYATVEAFATDVRTVLGLAETLAIAPPSEQAYTAPAQTVFEAPDASTLPGLDSTPAPRPPRRRYGLAATMAILLLAAAATLLVLQPWSDGKRKRKRPKRADRDDAPARMEPDAEERLAERRDEPGVDAEKARLKATVARQGEDEAQARLAAARARAGEEKARRELAEARAATRAAKATAAKEAAQRAAAQELARKATAKAEEERKAAQEARRAALRPTKPVAAAAPPEHQPVEYGRASTGCRSGVRCPPNYATLKPIIRKLCAGSFSDADLSRVRSLFGQGQLVYADLLALANIPGGFHGYRFKSVKWLNGFMYDSRASEWLPTECKSAFGRYARRSSVPRRMMRWQTPLQAFRKSVR